MKGTTQGKERLVVAKVGSSTLLKADGSLNKRYMADLCRQICTLLAEGTQVVLVSSGAVAAGMERLGLAERPKDVPGLQACAAAGQAALIETYAETFQDQGVTCAQVLLTREDTARRESYLNARNTFERLLGLGCVPIVNENDTISVEEFAFGDNDSLGAIVASLVDASLYVILSDVAGLYTANPQTDPSATLIPRVTRVDDEIMRMASGTGSAVGTGGMTTKLRAARAMLAAGTQMVVAAGKRTDVLLDVAHGASVGTRFVPERAASRESARKLWIGLAGVTRGRLVVDGGAARALVRDGASLLPVGVRSVEGSFGEGDIVDVTDEQGRLLGRGAVRYASEDLDKVRGLKLEVVERFYPDHAGQAAIHRDDLLVF